MTETGENAQKPGAHELRVAIIAFGVALGLLLVNAVLQNALIRDVLLGCAAITGVFAVIFLLRGLYLKTG